MCLPNNGADTSGSIISDSSSLIMSTLFCVGEPATSSFNFWPCVEESTVATEMPIDFCEKPVEGFWLW